MGKLELWIDGLRHECAVIATPLRRADATRSRFRVGFRKVAPWVWSEEAVLVGEKWARVREREEELDRWVGEAAVWVYRLKVATGVMDGPVVAEV